MQQQCHAKTKEVFLNAGNLFSSGPNAPLEALVKVLSANKGALLFRVTWDSSATLFQDDAVLLYNRQNHTLKYYYWIDSIVSDKEPGPVLREASSQTTLYRRVKDSTIRRLLAKYSQSDIGTDQIIPHLVSFGCKKQQLKTTSRRYHLK